VQKLCWKMLLPITLGNVFLTGALILIDPSLELLAIVGLVEIAGIVLITSAVARKGEAPAAAHAAHAHAAPAGH
ncbi:MAG: NADH-quinone oxidoreductase subunit H, partial [Anaeromyxobacteraceae bacterium]